jgi:peptide/nickel transport system substrate-binding protein
MKRVTLLAALVSLVVVAAMSVGCVSEEPISGGALVYVTDKAPQRMDPYNTSWMSEVEGWVYDRLISVTTDGVFGDGLAETWEFNEDATTLTLHLKRGVTFHDGTPFDADAVVWNYEQTKRPTFVIGFEWGAVEDCVRLDQYTVRYVFKQPYTHMLGVLATRYASMVSPTAYALYGEDYGVGTNVVGTGPFVLTEYVAGEYAVLARNDDYSWGPAWLANKGAPYLDVVKLMFVPEAATAVLMLETGEADIVYGIPSSDVGRLDALPDVEIESFPNVTSYVAFYDTQVAPFDDIVFRMALSHAVDKAALVQAAFSGEAYACDSYFPPGFPSYLPELAGSTAYNPQLARSMLAAAGYETPLEVSILAIDDSLFRQMATIVQAGLDEIGVKADIRLADKATADSLASENTFGIYLNYWNWVDPAAIMEIFLLSTSAPYPNVYGQIAADLDRLLQVGPKAPTESTRLAFYEQAQRMEAGYVTCNPLANPNAIFGIRSHVVGFTPNTPQFGYGGPDIMDTWIRH